MLFSTTLLHARSTVKAGLFFDNVYKNVIILIRVLHFKTTAKRFPMPTKRTDLPSSLKELLETDESAHNGFHLAPAYSIEIKHNGLECFPAIEIQTGNMVIVTNLSLLKMVCQTLAPREHKILTQLVYVNRNISRAYPVFSGRQEDLERSGPIQILTYSRFEALMDGVHPVFGWKPGIDGTEIRRSDFLEAVENAEAWLQWSE